MELDELRTQINVLNTELLRLFEKRMQLCGQVAEYKKEHAMDIFVPAREVEILEWVKASSKMEFVNYDLEFFNCLLNLSRRYQQTIVGEGPSSPIPAVKTDRLLLLPLSANDTEPVFSLTSNPQVAKYMRFDTHRSPEEARRLIMDYCKPGNLAYKILLAQTGEFIGVFALKATKESPAAMDISLFLAPDHWNRGYAEELLSAVQDLASRLMQADTLTAYVVSEHTASCRALEKAGYSLLKTLTFEDWDGALRVYTLSLNPNTVV